MNAKTLLALGFLFLLVGCVKPTTQPPDANSSGTPDMPNPASAYCEQQGYKLEIRTASDGNQSGVCVFPDGSECDEWAFYRNECTPASQGGSLPNPASVYCEQQGYTSEIRTASDGSQSGVCIFPDGSQCDEWAYYRRECTPATQDASMPNPASVYCEQHGYKIEIRTASDGSQSGVCVFPDGSECDEWSYFRGECSPSPSPSDSSQDWQTYTNEIMGYTFLYPAGAQVITNDDPTKSLSITGTGMGDEFWGVAHPTDREEYRPPEGADLQQWLSNHYLLGENQQADVQIAGTTALHFRHEASPQSYAFDQYYFAHSGQLYQITIGHGSDAEDWELDDRFLQSFQFIQPTSPGANALPTALPIDPAASQDWATYTSSSYGFSLRLPDGWIVDETSPADPLLVGHEINLYPVTATHPDNIRLTFRRVGEDTLLWPTGVGEGEFIQQATLDIGGQSIQRLLLVCPSGAVTALWYHQASDQPNITLGDLEFGIIFSTPGHCEPGNNLVGEAQQLGETIISSLHVP
jgi:putative hemolysin